MNPAPAADPEIKICAFGDSVLWGQGLQTKHKFITLFAKAISTHFKKPAKVQNLEEPDGLGAVYLSSPHSGATLVHHNSVDQTEVVYPSNEIPTSFPTVEDQVSSYEPHKDVVADVDYVVLNGCANDVSIGNFTHLPWASDMSDKQIQQETEKYCFQGMRRVLRKTLTRYPKATVVVPGYYQAVSDQTNPKSKRLSFLLGLATITDILRDLPTRSWEAIRTSYLNEIKQNSAQFAMSANNHLKQAVEAVTREPQFADRKVYFVDPKFTEQNAILAQKSFIWCLDPTALTRTEDDVRDIRWSAVQKQVKCSYFDLACNFKRTWVYPMVAIGHPNKAGAQQYADRMSEVLNLPKVTPDQ